MKKLVRFAVITACVMMCWSCIDEEDFDFDRLSQTTINPALGVRLFDTEVKLSDFLNFDSLLADVEGMELISRNDGNGEYLEFVYTRSDTFDVNDFVGIIDGMSDVSIELPAISVPDVSSLVSSGVDLSDVSVAYPALGVEMEDISVEVPEIEEGVSIDSLILTSGGIGIQSSTVLPFDVYIELSSSGIKDILTGMPYTQRIQICSSTGTLPSNSIDLSGYAVSLKDSVGQGDKTFLDLRYRIVIDLTSNLSSTGGDFAVNTTLNIMPLRIDLAYGKVGNAVVPVSDSIDLAYFDNEEVSNFISSGGIDFQKLTFEVETATNVGIGAYVVPNVYSITANGLRTAFFAPTDTLRITRAPLPGQIGTSSNILTTDAAAIEVLPNKIHYNLDIHFSDRLYDQSYPAFVYPFSSFIAMNTRTRLPLTAKLTDLHYETETSSLNFLEENDYIKSAELNLMVENEFPASLEVNFYLADSNGNIFDTLFAKPLVIEGSPVDSDGNVLRPRQDNIKLELTAEKYEVLRQASSVKFAIRLNTSSDSGSNRPYVRFKKDAAVRINASVKAITNITF